MITGLIRAQMSSFNMNSTGKLINKFSNDIGLLDNVLFFVFIDVIEIPIATAVALTNIFQINIYLIIPGSLGIVVLVFYFNYCKKTII